MPKEKSPKLTAKQKKLVKGIAEGKTQKEAAKAAGLHETYACNVLKEPKVKASLHELMEKAGLTDELILKTHVEMIEATKVISAVSGSNANAGTMDFVDVPDWQARAKGIEMAYKLKGSFAPEKREITLDVTKLTDEELDALIASEGAN